MTSSEKNLAMVQVDNTVVEGIENAGRSYPMVDLKIAREMAF